MDISACVITINSLPKFLGIPRVVGVHIMSLKDLRLIFLDCQTTGVSVASSHMLEIAWALGTAATTEQTLDQIQSSTVQLPDGAELSRAITKVTGITDADLATARPSDELYAAIQETIRNASNPVKAALIHFGRFERPYLDRMWQQASGGDFDLPILCTHVIARKLFPDFAHKGIRALAGYFGEPLDEAKRAACHVGATIRIWRGLVAALAEQGIETLEQLQLWLDDKTKIKRQKKSYKLEGARALDLPAQPGVYKFLGKTGKVLYVGKATSLKTRVASYFRRSRGGDSRKAEMLMQAWDVQVSPVNSPLEAALLECQEIKRLQPPYNIMYRGQPKHAVYYSRDFSTMSLERDDKHVYGPILYPQGLTELLALGVVEKVPEIISEIFYDLDDVSILRAGFDLICELRGWERDIFQKPRALMIHGVRLYREHLRALRDAASNEAEAIEIEASAAEAEEELEEEEFVWTPEEVAAKVDRILISSARMWFAGRRLARLSESDIVFSSAKQRGRTWHYIKVVDGKIDVSMLEGAVDVSLPEKWERPFAERQQTIDAAQYERLQILMQELRRCASKGADVQIRLGPKLWLKPSELMVF